MTDISEQQKQLGATANVLVQWSSLRIPRRRPSGRPVAARLEGGGAASFPLADGGGSVAWSASIIAPLQLRGETNKSLLNLVNVRGTPSNKVYLIIFFSTPPSSAAGAAGCFGSPSPFVSETLASLCRLGGPRLFKNVFFCSRKRVETSWQRKWCRDLKPFLTIKLF